MTKKAVEETFDALFNLTDLRQIYRETKPAFNLDDDQIAIIKQIIKKLRHNLDIIEKELVI